MSKRPRTNSRTEEERKNEIKEFIKNHPVAEILDALEIPNTPTLMFSHQCIAREEQLQKISKLQRYPIHPRVEDGKLTNEAQIEEQRRELAYELWRNERMTDQPNCCASNPPDYAEHKANLLREFENRFAIPIGRLKFMLLESLPFKFREKKRFVEIWDSFRVKVRGEIAMLEANFDEHQFPAVGISLASIAALPAEALPPDWKERKVGDFLLALSLNDNMFRIGDSRAYQFKLSELSEVVLKMNVRGDSDAKWVTTDEPGVWHSSKKFEPPTAEKRADWLFRLRDFANKSVEREFVLDVDADDDGLLRLSLRPDVRFMTDLNQ